MPKSSHRNEISRFATAERTPMQEHVYSIYLLKSSGSHLREYDLIRLSVANTTNNNARGCTTIHTANRWINIMHILHKSSGVVRLTLVYH